MTTEEYIEKTEKKLIETFLQNFHDKMGYYPIVLTNKDLKNKPVNILSLEKLESHFEPYLPKVYGKKLSLSSKARIREIVELRQVFCFISRSMGFSLKTIGNFLGNRDHTTIIHNVRTFHDMMQTNSYYKEKYTALINKIKEDGNYFNTSAMVSSDKTQLES